jgi:hypothetical protein
MIHTETSDKTAVTETVTRLFHAQDARDWETSQALLTEQVEMAHGSHQMTLSSEEFMAESKERLAGFDATQYLLGPVVVEFDAEDQATARFHVQWTALLTEATEESTYVHGAHYTVGLTRLRDTWKIHALSHEETYEKGDRDLLDVARQRAV